MNLDNNYKKVNIDEVTAEFERDRDRIEKILADVEAQRTTAEQKGIDVDAFIADVKAIWKSYEDVYWQFVNSDKRMKAHEKFKEKEVKRLVEAAEKSKAEVKKWGEEVMRRVDEDTKKRKAELNKWEEEAIKRVMEDAEKGEAELMIQLDEATDRCLHSIEKLVDAGDSLLKIVCEEKAEWDASLNYAETVGGMESVKAWEGYRLWKEQICEQLYILRGSTSVNNYIHHSANKALKILDG